MKNNPDHLSGELHVTGRTKFIFDELKPVNMLKMKLLHSKYANAEILSIDFSEAEKIAGVIKIFTAKDIPGENQIGVIVKDEPLLPDKKTSFVGQPIAAVVGETIDACNEAIKKINIKYKELKPILSIEEALKNNSIIDKEQKIKTGNPKKYFDKCDNILQGIFKGGGQEHLYLETQRSIVIPDEGNHFFVYSATQSPSEIQDVTARILNLKRKDITVDVKRLGGAFGGKERSATIWAALTALACFLTKRPVEFKLTRIEDIKYTGKRHPFETHYKVGFNNDGKIIAADFKFYINGGAYADLSTAILERGLWHLDNAYHIKNMTASGLALRTNLPPNTAFRGFGAPQGIFSIEYIIERIAFKTNKDIFEIRELNAYKEGEKTPYSQPVYEVCFDEIFKKLKENSNYLSLRKQCNDFNNKNKFLKKGIGIIPVKFGISFTTTFLNQGTSLIWVYTDGSISVSHGGVEMGQEINTKIAQIVANEFGVDIEKIKMESTNTKRAANTSPTAASCAIDLNGNAAKIASQKIISRLISLAVKIFKKDFNKEVKKSDICFKNNYVFDKNNDNEKIPFSSLVNKAYINRINLGAQAFYKTPNIYFNSEKGKGHPFYYFVYGAALTEVKVDTLTGMYKFEKVFIVHENAKTLNYNVDLGQIEGAFIQGLGWCTMEEVLYNEKGENITSSTSTYKIPTISDLPEVFSVDIMDRIRKFSSVYGLKGIGEPPFIYGQSAYFALKNAVESISNHKKESFLRFPATPEAVLLEIENQKN